MTEHQSSFWSLGTHHLASKTDKSLVTIKFNHRTLTAESLRHGAQERLAFAQYFAGNGGKAHVLPHRNAR